MAVPPAYWWSRDFPGEKTQARSVRAWIESFLPACDALDDLVLIASELAANAVTHTRSGQADARFTVDVTWSPDCARVVVGDQGSDEIPDSPGNPGEQELTHAETGRGLLIVYALSAAWGLAGNADARWLWADVPWLSRGGPPPATVDGNRDAGLELAEFSRAYPGTRAWFDEQSGEWTATPPQPDGADDIVRAPSPTALRHMLAARHLAIR
jgi:anti-sigma regulatory factor (Ser/Thr protein kinase)